MTVYGIGYIGKGKYKSKENGKNTHQYMTWREMIRRCYSEKYHERCPTYKGCSVAEEWHCFQNFAEWYDQNYYQIEGEVTHLDKDIIVKGNRVYSPNTCVFVPQKINVLFIKNNIRRGDLPIGVSLKKSSKKLPYVVVFSIGIGKTITIGCYGTPEEAFNSYKELKEKHIKEVANEYKNKIPILLYDALIKYEVEIND
jgi:hypothetical protein